MSQQFKTQIRRKKSAEKIVENTKVHPRETNPRYVKGT